MKRNDGIDAQIELIDRRSTDKDNMDDDIYDDDIDDDDIDDDYEEEIKNYKFSKDNDTCDIEEELNATVWEDLFQSLYDVRMVAPFLALLGILLTYHLTIAPYRNYNHYEESTILSDLSTVRPILSENTLMDIQQIAFRAETELMMPPPFSGTVSYRFFQSVDKHGNFELPPMFYEGVLFGITAENSHHIKYSNAPDLSQKELFDELINMKPVPTYILLRSATCNSTMWRESGYGVYFSYKDLTKQGMLSSDRLAPFKRVKEEVLVIARKFKQIYITIWYPSQFGMSDQADDDDGSGGGVSIGSSSGVGKTKMKRSEEEEEKEKKRQHYSHYEPKEKMKHKYTTIVQSIVPTRTGLNALVSNAVVWLSAVNDTIPTMKQRVFRRVAYENENGTYYEYY